MGLPEDLPLTPAELKKVFKAAGYTTYRQLGLELGVSKPTICKWLSGKRKLSEKAKKKIRCIRVVPGAEPQWNAYLAEVPLTIAHYKENLPPLSAGLETDVAPTVDPKALAKAVAREIGLALKMDPEELAGLLVEKFDAEAVAADIADLLLPDLRHVVELVAEKVADILPRYPDTSEAIEPALAACVERVTLLLQQNTSEARSRLDGLAHLFKVALDALAEVVKRGLDGLGSKADSQSRQDAQERAEDRVKRDELGNAVQEIGAKADELGKGVKGLDAKTDELGKGVKGLDAKTDELGKGVKGLDAKTDAHHEQTGRWILALGGIVVVGFAGVIVTVVACTHAGGPVSGTGLTRGGGVAEEAAKTDDQHYGSLGPGVGASLGERKTGRPMPHSPLPHQATGNCPAGITKLFNACWLKAADQRPPCLPDFFEYANACYLPIAADPNVPVGETPLPGQETPTREQLDAGMPGKEP